jgi:hypothetical protein
MSPTASATVGSTPAGGLALRAALTPRPDEAPDDRGVLQRLEPHPQGSWCDACWHARHPSSLGHGHRQLGPSGEGGHDVQPAYELITRLDSLPRRRSIAEQLAVP